MGTLRSGQQIGSGGRNNRVKYFLRKCEMLAPPAACPCAAAVNACSRRTHCSPWWNPASHRERRGARLTRREEGAYWAYATDEQRRQAGCIAARMQRRLSPRADWAPPRSGTAGRCQATSKTDPPRFPCRWRGPRAARLADTVRGRHEAGRRRHRRCCGEHREGMTAMAHRRRVSSAPPASRSPVCPPRAPYRRRALWTCPAYGRPVRNGLHPQSGDTGAHSPLEISRATAGDRAGAEAARFPQVHSACIMEVLPPKTTA